MLRRLGIRTKVLAVLALPVLVLLGTSGYIAVQSVSQARTAAAVSRVVQVLPEYADAIQALQQERTLSMQTVSGDDLSGSLPAARTNTDATLATLADTLAELDVSGLDPRVGEAIEAATLARGRLTSMREQVDADTVSSAAVIESNVTDIIAAHNTVPALVAETLSDRSLASRLSAYGQVAGTIERVLRTQPAVLEVLDDQGTDPDEIREMSALFAVADEARATARTTTNNLRLNDIQLASRSADLTAMQIALSNGNQLNIQSMDPVRWNTLVNTELNILRATSDDLLASADARAGALASAAQRESAFTIGLTVAATALSIVIAFVVSRGIVVPLRRLTSAAGEVRAELPRLVEQVAEPGRAPDLSLAEIPVTSQDEVGRLAEAFNSVNATTIQVARDQAALRGSIAEMFVNVARRDQVLLGRQLAFIDSLERSEEDPATLANLFRLDHLATRMRRNAESLLVLAGIDSGRRLREAMPLSDVVRTASSEIEQYDRVQLDLGVDPLMHGFNALAAAHLMAELLENATLFSEPGTPVAVRTGEVAAERSGDRQVLVTITDQGLGMSDEELDEANATIGSAAATDAIGAQRLGLFVVARLAARLGATVTLSRVTDGGSGTVATVALPGALFTTEPATTGLVTTTGSLPLVDQPPAAAVPVDLAALTDGATDTGLPRRRREAGPPVSSEPEVVLPVPAAATLAPEVAAASMGWAPEVAAEGGVLPSREPGLPTRDISLPSRTSGLPTQSPDQATALPDAHRAAAPVPSAPRAGLFAGFRGRAVTTGPTAAESPAGSAIESVDAGQVPVDGFVVPGLMPEEDEPLEAEGGNTAFRPLPFSVPEPFDPPLTSASDPVVPVSTPEGPGTADTGAAPEPVADIAVHAGDSTLRAEDEPAAAPSRPVERVSVPDFATVVRGDSSDDPAAPRRDRARRGRASWFSARRRRGTEPRAVTGAHALVTPPAGAVAPAPVRRSVATAVEASTVEPASTVPSEPTPTLTPFAAGRAAGPSTGWSPQETEPTPEQGAPARSGWSPARSTEPEPSQAVGGQPRSDQADGAIPSAWSPSAAVAALAPPATDLGWSQPGTDPVPAGADWVAAEQAWAPEPAEPTPAAQPATSATAAEGASITGWAPQQVESPTGVAAVDQQGAAMLAMRADIQEQALSELSQLSAYRPTSVDRPTGSLTRRVPHAVPEAPAFAPAASTTPRDADAVRDRLASFQSGTRRGRRAQGDGPADADTGPAPVHPTPIP
ncbi:nitrate- and nitrite sensing domain-containing protein [Cellulomonas sp. NPDC089187]|uniref:sensor histidine kinase n=1 Tax=Cellulomonas sp. NPDC089187 TaxID=3154970 RepID=UPI003441E49C